MKISIISAAVLFLATAATAQVKFKISKLADNETYQVIAVAESDYVFPQSIVSTGQVTVKAPANSLAPVDILPGTGGARWAKNSIASSPAEAKGWDYISFGLIDLGTRNVEFKKGKEVVLFSFKNAYKCSGEVSLMDNATDPFRAPNSQSANVGQQITILGAGGDAFAGVMKDGGSVPCADPTAFDDKEQSELFWVYPNPSMGPVTVNSFWKGDEAEAVTIRIVDMTGRAVWFKKTTMQPGFNTWSVDLSTFPEANFHVTFTGDSGFFYSLNNMINLKR